MYECKDHSYRYNLPVGDSTENGTVVGDVLGHWVVNGGLWRLLWPCFQESESFAAVEKLLRATTESALLEALAVHPSKGLLTAGEREQLHHALVHHCLASPDYQTLKSWMHTCAQCMVMPLIPALARKVIGAFGVIVNVDFSSSDAKQLLPKRKRKRLGQAAELSNAPPVAHAAKRLKRKLWAGAYGRVANKCHSTAPRGRRTWGAATGLHDVPLLPALFSRVEENATKLQILQVTFRPQRGFGAAC